MTESHSTGNATQLGLRELPVTLVDHGENPRTDFASTDMAGLTNSVRENGVLSPIRVTIHPEGEGERYTVVFGHRRLEAAKAAKLQTIPAIVAEPGDEDFIASLVENIQREDLSALEEAQAYQNLRDAGMKVTDIGKRVGKSQPHISNMLRLLKLPDKIQAKVRTGELTGAHAKNLVNLPAEYQKEIAERIVTDKLTVREVEEELTEARASAAEEKQEEERQANEAAKFTSNVNVLKAEYKAHKWTKKAKIVFEPAYGLTNSDRYVEAMREAGYTGFTKMVFASMAIEPRWECDCTAVLLSANRVRGDNPRVCIVLSHREEYEDARKAIEAAAREEAFKRFEKDRRLIQRGLRDGEHGLLTVVGHRVALYGIFRAMSRYGSSIEFLTKFQERHGGPETDNRITRDYGPIWETISGLSEADLGEELVTAILTYSLTNPYSEQARYSIDEDHTIRAFFSTEFQTDAELEWGRWAPAPDAPPDLEVIEGGLEATDESQDEEGDGDTGADDDQSSDTGTDDDAEGDDDDADEPA